MSNSTVGFGLKPIIMEDGPEIGLRRVEVDSSNTAAIGLNSPVKIEADGNATRAAGDSIAGVVKEIWDSSGIPVGTDGGPRYLPASTAGTLFIIPSTAEVEYELRADADLTSIPALGTTWNINDAAPNSTTGISGCTLDGSNTTTGDQVVITGIVTRQDNTPGAAYQVVRVKIADRQTI